MNIALTRLPDNSYLLRKYLDENNMCCGLCCSVFMDKYTHEKLSSSLDAVNTLIDTRKINFSNLDFISKGRILEDLLNEIRSIDVFDNLNAYKFSRLLFHLRTFLTEQFLNSELQGTHAFNVMEAWKLKQKEHLELVQKKQELQSFSNERKKFKKNIFLKEKNIRKKTRDKRRKRFLFIFKQLDSVNKLRAILNGLDFPINAIPDNYFFKPSLMLRFKVKQEFNQDEIEALIKIFGGKMKNNKNKTYRKILKVLL